MRGISTLKALGTTVAVVTTSMVALGAGSASAALNRCTTLSSGNLCVSITSRQGNGLSHEVNIDYAKSSGGAIRLRFGYRNADFNQENRDNGAFNMNVGDHRYFTWNNVSGRVPRQCLHIIGFIEVEKQGRFETPMAMNCA